MDFVQILKYIENLVLPVAILIVFTSVLYYLLRQEKKEHKQTHDRLLSVYSRLEDRLYRELDELEKLLREERARIK